MSNTFPLGYHNIHPDVSLNFQMNRWFNWVGDAEMLEEMRDAAPRIHTYSDWQHEFLLLAEKAMATTQSLKAAYYFRAADFFMKSADPHRMQARTKFVRLVLDYHGDRFTSHFKIPYVDGSSVGWLPVYRFTPVKPKGVILFFGGFDSYIEELFQLFMHLHDFGYDVIAFEGPGQGGALFDAHLPMTPDWEKPVRAVLDYLALDDVTLIGLSLGGCLALRAAAHENRVRRVVAFDILYDFLQCNLRQVPTAIRRALVALLRCNLDFVVNALLKSAARRSPVIEWGLQQGMHVTGTKSPADYLRAVALYTTSDISARVTQDVLLLAGAQDHFVPVSQLSEQMLALPNARSVTARIFTQAESGQNHVQVGNLGLALQVITGWLDQVGDNGPIPSFKPTVTDKPVPVV